MLTLEGVSKSFGGVVALRNVTLTAKAGEITGLIGPNGSGKSTLFNVISGILRLDSGRISLFGEPLDTRRPDIVSQRGVIRTYQVPRIATQMTVLENLLVAPNNQLGEKLTNLALAIPKVQTEERMLRSRAWDVLRQLDLAHLANGWAGLLSGGQRKLLSLGIALMTKSDALLLDEPVAGVNPVLITHIQRILTDLCMEQKIILVIEHNIKLVSDICAKVYVLDEGQLIAEGTPRSISDNHRVRRAYLGIKAGARND